LNAVAASLELKSADDLFAAIGYGALGPQQVVGRLRLRDETPPEPEFPSEAPAAAVPASGQVRVMGVGDLLTRLAPCCHPAPGDDIIGYITRNRGVTVHRVTCPRVLAEPETERLVQVEWGPAVSQSLYPVAVVVNAWDREGLLRDVSAAVTDERVNITAATVTSGTDHSATIRITLAISSTEQLSRVFSHIERVRGVVDVSREKPRKVQTA
jgi:GTP pyrophosphokinase